MINLFAHNKNASTSAEFNDHAGARSLDERILCTYAEPIQY